MTVRGHVQHLVGAEASRVVGVKAVVGESVLPPVEVVEPPAVRTDPDIARGILAEGADVVIAERAAGKLLLVQLEFLAGGGGQVDAAAMGAHPEIAFQVLEQGGYGPLGQSMPGLILFLIAGEGGRSGIIQVEAAVDGAYPQMPLPVGQQAFYHIAGEAAIVSLVVAE